MSRYIDADALREEWLYENGTFEPNDVLDSIDCQPTVDAVPVVHGEWTIDGMNEYELSYGCIGYEPRYRCSRCGITTESYLRTEKPIMPEDADFPNYCPNCGAKMDGETEHGNTYSLGKIEMPKGAIEQIIADGERKDGERKDDE